MGKIFLKKIIRKYEKELWIYYFVMISYVSISFYIPIALSRYIDNIIGLQQVMNNSLVIIICLSLLEFITKSLKEEFNIRLSNKLAFNIEYDVSDNIMHADYCKIKKYDDVYLTQRINNDSVILGDFLCEKLPYFITDIITILLITSYVFCVSPSIGLLFVSFFAVYYFIYFISKKAIYKFAEKMFDSQARFFSMLSGQFNSVLLVKLNSWYQEKRDEFKSIVKEFYKKSISFLRLEFIIKNSNNLIGRIIMILVLLFLTNQIEKGYLTVGLITSLVMFIEIVIAKLDETIVFGDSFQKYKLALNRIIELNDLKKEENGEELLTSIETIKLDRIVCDLDNVKLVYPDITLKKNRVYLIKGENGSGKSTLVNILLGIIQPNQGMIYYNEIPISQINTIETRRNRISIKNQEPYIVEGTLAENITYGNGEIIRVEKQDLNNWFKFAESRGKMQMQISPKSNELSGGEKQRIAIGRAIYKQSDLLILDEPTNGLDMDAKLELVKIINRIKDKIIVIITHDALFDSICDEVIELNN